MTRSNDAMSPGFLEVIVRALHIGKIRWIAPHRQTWIDWVSPVFVYRTAPPMPGPSNMAIEKRTRQRVPLAYPYYDA